MGALGLDIDRVQRLARGHEQTVSLLAAEADIGAGFWQANLTDQLAVRRENLDAVIVIANPSRTDPDIALGIDPHAVRKAGFAVQRHVDQRARVRQLVAVEIVLPDDVLRLRVVGDAGVADINLLVVVAESDAIRLEGIFGDFGHLAGLAVEPVDRLFLIGLDRPGIGLLALIDTDRAVTGIGEPDRAVIGVHDDIVRTVELFAVGLLGQHGERAVMLIAHEPRPLAGNLPALEVEGVAIALVGRLVELLGNMAVIVEIAKLAVGRNIAPYEILALCVPRRSLGPQTTGVEALDGGVADLGLEALGVDHDNIGIGIALGFGAAAEVARGGTGGYDRCGDGGRAAQQTAAVEAARFVVGL